MNVGVDQNNDGRPDAVKVVARQTVENQNVVVSDVPVKGEASGGIVLDADPSPGDQRKTEGTTGSDSLASVALYAENVQELTRFVASVQFDTTRLEFAGFEMPVTGAGEDRPILSGRQDGASVVREKVAVARDAGEAKVEGDKVQVEGKLLDGRSGNASSGNGLLGILKFAQKAGQSLGGGKPSALAASGDAKVTVKEVTLLGVDKKKVILEAGVVTIKVGQAGKAGDLTGDGKVDFDDFFQLAGAFGKSKGQAGFDARADLNGDGKVDFDDVFVFASAFGK